MSCIFPSLAQNLALQHGIPGLLAIFPMFQANCRTTAMGVMPFTQIQPALDLALSLDIPFWPQLPRLSFYHDMYAQTAVGFPGISVNIAERKLRFSASRFQEDINDYSLKMAEPGELELKGEYAESFEAFLARDLAPYAAVRGQSAGAVTLGFNVLDEENRPIIYNEEVKALLFDFIQRKANQQYYRLKEKNPNAFVWIDDPALSYVFNSMYGYTDIHAREDYRTFLEGLEGPHGLHLCTNVNLPFLLELGVDILSFDAYQMESMPEEYARAAARFLENGGILCWGLVPTEMASLEKETPDTSGARLEGYWNAIVRAGGPSVKEIAAQSLLAPAKCCVKDFWRNRGAAAETCAGDFAPTLEERSVRQAFGYLRELSARLRDQYGL